MYWINFLHFYQPPHQDPHLLKRIAKESYLYIVKTLKKNPDAKITLNISGALTEQLIKYKLHEILENIQDLAKKGQIELVGSAKYHPILPLLPKEEIVRQITINNSINKSCFGSIYQPKGFYLPEMAYSKNVAAIVKELGFEWILLDEIAFHGSLGHAPNEKQYKIKDIGLTVVFRNRMASKSYVPETILEYLKNNKRSEYLITATDGEMYGHHHKDYAKLFDKSLKEKQITTLTMSQLLRRYSDVEAIDVLDSSWESTPDDLKNKIPYPLWQDPKNKIHTLLWELASLSIKTVNENKQNENEWARKHLDQGLASCSWWWASGKQPDVFSPVGWNPTEIERGVKDLVSSIRSLSHIPPKIKIQAEGLFLRLSKEIWKKHWGFSKKKIKSSSRHFFKSDILEKKKNAVLEKYKLTSQHILSTTGHYYVTNCIDEHELEYILKIRLENTKKAEKTFLREIAFWNILKNLKSYKLVVPEKIFSETAHKPEYLLYQMIPGQSAGILYYFYEPNSIEQQVEKIIYGLIAIQKNSDIIVQSMPKLEKKSFRENMSYYKKFLKTASLHLSPQSLLEATKVLKEQKSFLNTQPLKINHADLNPRNFIMETNNAAIIDWSNVELNNSMMDAAFFSLASWQNKKISQTILQTYQNSFSNKKIIEKLFLVDQIILIPKFVQVLHDSIKYADIKQKELIQQSFAVTQNILNENIKKLKQKI